MEAAVTAGVVVKSAGPGRVGRTAERLGSAGNAGNAGSSGSAGSPGNPGDVGELVGCRVRGDKAGSGGCGRCGGGCSGAGELKLAPIALTSSGCAVAAANSGLVDP